MSVEDKTNISIVRVQLTGPNFIEGLLEAGKDIVSIASQLAPRESGDLANSGEAHIEGNKVVVSFGEGLPDGRAIAQEYGTIFMPAQPYLIPAIKNTDILFHVRRKLGLD